MWKGEKMRKLSIIVLLVLLAIGISAETPSNEKIQEMMDTRPEIIYEMVKKLYVVEKAIPRITVPDQNMFFTVGGDLIVGYEGEGTIEIGEGNRSLSYSFKLHPQIVLGFLNEGKEIHPVWYAMGGVIIFAGGLVAGFLIGK